MNTDLSDSAGLDPREVRAAEWLHAERQGLTAAQKAEFEAWLAADPSHVEFLEEMRLAWDNLDRVPATRVEVAERSSWMRRYRLPLGLAAAATIAIVFTLTRSTLPTTPTPLTVAGVETKILPDKSIVYVRSGGAIDVRFNSSERRVVLSQGEAGFSVSPDPSRPFIVNTKEVDIRVLGTTFNVRLDPQAVEVLVTEGKVKVEARQSLATPAGTAPSPKENVLSSGEKVVIPIATQVASASPGNPVMTVPAEEASRELAWQNPLIEFDGEPLARLVATFNRFNRHQLVIADPRLEERRFGGKFRARDHQQFIRFLQDNFEVVAETDYDRTILKVRP